MVQMSTLHTQYVSSQSASPSAQFSRGSDGMPGPVKTGAPWALIAVMGVTGSGKSTFIRKISGDDSVMIGDGLESCTSELKAYTFSYAGYNINLVDSPGFNDTFRTETEVLQDISGWLKETYEKDNKLSGIIYLHGINHTRVYGSSLRNLLMFRELCGEDPLKNVVLATTFWDSVSEEVGANREKQLATEPKFWGGMVNRGARMTRFTDVSSGLQIIESLINGKPEPLKIQRELVESGKSLIETGAGQVVNEELVRLEKLHQTEKEKMKNEMAEALRKRDIQMQEALQEQSKQLEDEIDRVHRQQNQLKADRRAETRRLENQFESAMYELRTRNQELVEDVELLQGDAQRRQRERIAQDERLVQLERYNTEAQKKWEGLDIEAVIAKIRAEEGKLRAEEREKLEAEIQRLRKNESQILKGRKRDMAVQFFFGALRTALPLVSMFTLGIPISLPSFSGFSNSTGN